MKRRSFLALPLAGAVAANSATSSPSLKLGVIADPQFADKEPAGTRHYRASLDKLRAAVRSLNSVELDAVVTLGDFIDEDFASFAPVMEIYRGIKAPHLKVLGNHDFSVADDHKAGVLAALSLEKPYSSVILGGWRIVLLDGTESSTYRQPPGDPATRAAEARIEAMTREGRKNAFPWNGGIGPQQLEWLEKELAASASAGQRAILCCHYPVLPEDPLNLWNDRELLALIDRFPCIAAWFNGHNHGGNYAPRGHCHFLNFKGMVETAERSAFAIVRGFPDRLEIEGFDLEPARKLPL